MAMFDSYNEYMTSDRFLALVFTTDDNSYHVVLSIKSISNRKDVDVRNSATELLGRAGVDFENRFQKDVFLSDLTVRGSAKKEGGAGTYYLILLVDENLTVDDSNLPQHSIERRDNYFMTEYGAVNNTLFNCKFYIQTTMFPGGNLVFEPTVHNITHQASQDGRTTAIFAGSFKNTRFENIGVHQTFGVNFYHQYQTHCTVGGHHTETFYTEGFGIMPSSVYVKRCFKPYCRFFVGDRFNRVQP